MRGAAAVVMRLVLTLAVASVLTLPGVRFVGALLLLGIAVKLVQDGGDVEADGTPAPTGVRTAVFRIAVADLVMSLDNVGAVAGVSGKDPVLLGTGLVLSIVGILAFSRVILALMSRLPWVVSAGTGVLALRAAGMTVHDLETLRGLTSASSSTHAPAWAGWAFRGVVVALCVTSGRWRPRRPSAVPHAVATGSGYGPGEVPAPVPALQLQGV